ncbi:MULTISPECIES: alpha/beta hydrolase [Staphylococcus]|uniref:alpha/beta hydrolase n=1 Tax=Staphylococcus TaxID=1279 RepID=UPI001F540D18|nr:MULTISPECIES: alpha/beta hydrolase [Staphylococcus]MDT0705716.1 alpha/beta hydrolase [Staphylococcus haemolyticus]
MLKKLTFIKVIFINQNIYFNEDTYPLKSYKESKYERKKAQHNELHEKKQVANEIVEFLLRR